jgi:hypothetical protein
MTLLLSDIEQDKVGGLGPALSYGKATWDELKKLNKDAGSAAKAEASP